MRLFMYMFFKIYCDIIISALIIIMEKDINNNLEAECSLEDRMIAFSNVRNLVSLVLLELNRVYDDIVAIEEFFEIQDAIINYLIKNGEDIDSLLKYSAYHGLVGSTVVFDKFSEETGELLIPYADFDEDKSILKYLLLILDGLKKI